MTTAKPERNPIRSRESSVGNDAYRGQTILITGASSGLGEEFARELAGRGASLVLVARRRRLLETLAAELKRAHGVDVTVIERDLGTAGAGRTLRAELEARGIHATGLINCAGFGTQNDFEDEDPDRLQAMIAVNVAALVDLSHAYYASLKKDNGILINVASLLGFQPTPYLSVYGATKAFVLSFTESLWEEARGTGLRVLALSPGPMKTGFFEAAGSDSADYGAPRVSAEQVVKRALAALDRRNPPPSIVTNGRPLVLIGRFLPRRTVVHAMGAMQRRARRQGSRTPSAERAA